VKASTPSEWADGPPSALPEPEPLDDPPLGAPLEPEVAEPPDPDDPPAPPDGPVVFDPTDPVCPGEVDRGVVVGVEVAEGSTVNGEEKIFGCEKSFWSWPM
jgi:hypothetical protein